MRKCGDELTGKGTDMEIPCIRCRIGLQVLLDICRILCYNRHKLLIIIILIKGRFKYGIT